MGQAATTAPRLNQFQRVCAEQRVVPVLIDHAKVSIPEYGNKPLEKNDIPWPALKLSMRHWLLLQKVQDLTPEGRLDLIMTASGNRRVTDHYGIQIHQGRDTGGEVTKWQPIVFENYREVLPKKKPESKPAGLSEQTQKVLKDIQRRARKAPSLDCYVLSSDLGNSWGKLNSDTKKSVLDQLEASGAVEVERSTNKPHRFKLKE
jgi:hypothetical protein